MGRETGNVNGRDCVGGRGRGSEGRTRGSEIGKGCCVGERQGTWMGVLEGERETAEGAGCFGGERVIYIYISN